MNETTRTAVSHNSKKYTPTNDSQDKNVYKLDRLIFKLLNDNNKLNFKESYCFFDTAIELFKKEGLTNYSFFNNKSQRVSNVNPYKKKVTFSDEIISSKNYEVLFHEMAHALVYYRGDYNYVDHHGEMFLFYLFYLICKYTNIKISELENFADNKKVSYFYNSIIENKSLSKNEFEKAILENDFLNKKRNLNDVDFLYSGFDLDKEIFISLFSNGDTFWILKRHMFLFEKAIKIDPFKKCDINILSNIFIISPVYNVDVSGYKIKSGKFKSFCYLNLNAELKVDHYQVQDSNKKEIDLLRKNLIIKMKRSGYKIYDSRDFSQYEAIRDFYIKRVN